MPTLASRVLRGHTEYCDELAQGFAPGRGVSGKACPDCCNPLRRGSSGDPDAEEHGLDLYSCKVCGGFWFLAARH